MPIIKSCGSATKHAPMILLQLLALKSALGSTSKHPSLLHQTKFAAVCFTHVFDFSIDSLISQKRLNADLEGVCLVPLILK